jgi:hypothetical protein
VDETAPTIPTITVSAALAAGESMTIPAASSAPTRGLGDRPVNGTMHMSIP